MLIPEFSYNASSDPSEAVRASQEQFEEHGAVIFPSVLTNAMLDKLRDALQPYFEQNITGRNEFEGIKSNRVYGLLAKGEVFSQLATHPLSLTYAEHELGQSCLLSAMLAICLQPGETVQPWHTDDGHIDIPAPRPAYGISTFWALDDVTQENGATELLLGSHKWDMSYDQIPGALQFQNMTANATDDDEAESVKANIAKAIMPAGSLMIAKGNLWHRGGANNSQKSRTIVTPQYCSGWARQLENQLLSVPPEVAKTLPLRAQELIGYSIHPPFMGYVDGVHPNKQL